MDGMKGPEAVGCGDRACFLGQWGEVQAAILREGATQTGDSPGLGAAGPEGEPRPEPGAAGFSELPRWADGEASPPLPLPQPAQLLSSSRSPVGGDPAVAGAVRNASRCPQREAPQLCFPKACASRSHVGWVTRRSGRPTQGRACTPGQETHPLPGTQSHCPS